MAILSMFIQTLAKLGVMELDASVSETHEASASLTQTQVEDGFTITDSITLGPKRLTIEGVISQTPLASSALVSSLATAAGGVLGKSLGGVTKLSGAAAIVGSGSIGGLVSKAAGLDDFGVSGASRKAEDVYSYLIKLWEDRVPFDVVTGLHTYKQMVITNLSIPRNAQTTNIIRFTASLEQVKIVSAQTVNIAALNSLSGGKAESAVKAGKQGAKEISSKLQDNASIAYSWIYGS